MNNYMIMRRAGWRTDEEIDEAANRSRAKGSQMVEDLRWIRSYLVREEDGSFGSICIYQATGPEAIREHAKGAGLPVDEILEITDAIVVRPDPEPAHA